MPHVKNFNAKFEGLNKIKKVKFFQVNIFSWDLVDRWLLGPLCSLAPGLCAVCETGLGSRVSSPIVGPCEDQSLKGFPSQFCKNMKAGRVEDQACQVLSVGCQDCSLKEFSRLFQLPGLRNFCYLSITLK